MTQEDKDLLIKDLCARLSYGVKCYAYQYKIDGNDCECCGILTGINNGYFYLSDRVSVNGGKTYDERYLEVKPYLRPMSSMTEREKDYIKNVARFKQSDGIHYDDGVHYVPIYQETLDDQWKTDGKFPPILDDIYRFMFDYGYIILVDWLNTHYFDYRDLIEKGLALEASEGMYNTKTE